MSAVPKNLRAFAGMLESINEAIAVLDKVETMTAFEAEHAQRVAAMTKQRDDLLVEIAKGQEGIAQAQRIAIQTVEQAQRDGETIKARLASEADDILATAKDAAAKAKARENASEAAERKAKEGLVEIQAKVADRTKELGDIQAKIEAAKAAARASFGG